MQPLSKSTQGNTYTIKWMFGAPEVMDYMRSLHIEQGSVIQVIRKFRDCLIIGADEHRIVLGNEVADRIQV